MQYWLSRESVREVVASLDAAQPVAKSARAVTLGDQKPMQVTGSPVSERDESSASIEREESPEPTMTVAAAEP
jgi:hypothetical protein